MIIRSLEQHVSMGMVLQAFSCRIATFIIKPEYTPVAVAWKDQEKIAGAGHQPHQHGTCLKKSCPRDPRDGGTRQHKHERMKPADCSVD